MKYQDLENQLLEALAERDKYIEAIRKHRDQRGDDRCWLDNIELYKTLPEGFDDTKYDLRLHTLEEMLPNCRKFIEFCHDPSKPYVSPQREIERLRNIIATVSVIVGEAHGSDQR